MTTIDKKLDELSKSKFRSSFHLNDNMKQYVYDHGIDKIKEDAYNLIRSRIGEQYPKNDGKQTPMRANSHPVFIAQHACATCCRGCLSKWHHIPEGIPPTEHQIDYIVDLLMTWIKREITK
ncbi:MAG TPA: DUF4186 domain-containing protein [Bacilli bacterium]|nr:DUF4186 domain-containing protein [Bacilli bacterium]